MPQESFPEQPDHSPVALNADDGKRPQTWSQLTQLCLQPNSTTVAKLSLLFMMTDDGLDLQGGSGKREK